MTSDPWAFQRWAYQQVTGNPIRKAVLMMLAVMADAQTGRCEAKQTTIAQGVEAGERSVSVHLGKLEAMGLIARRPQFRIDRGRRSDEYLLLMPGVVEWPDGQKIDQPAPSAGGQNATPPASGDTPPPVSDVRGKNYHQELPPPLSASQRSENRTAETPSLIDATVSEPSREGAREGGESKPTVRHGGRKVSAVVADASQAALAHWNERTGQALKPFNGRGKVSESLRVIVGAMLDYPEAVTLWPDMIDAALRSPWWTDDAPGPGVVFGGKVRERMVQQAQRPAIAAGAGGNVHRMRLSGGAAKDGWSAADILRIAGVTS